MDIGINDDRQGAEVHREIGDINLAYMLLAQKLVREDRATAMFRLGIGDELADLLSRMSLSQILKLAASNLLVCSFRLDKIPMVNVAADGRDAGLQQAHMSILMAARQVRVGSPAFA